MTKPDDIFSIGNSHSERVPRRHYRVDWVENSYSPGAQTSGYVSSNFETGRLRWVFLGVVVFFGILFFRTAYLQIISGNEYRIAAEDNRIRIHEIKAPRGVIYDRTGTELAVNVPNFVVSFTPADLPVDPAERVALIEKVADTTGESVEAVTLVIDDADSYSYESHTLVEHLDYTKAIMLQLQAKNLPGISVTPSTFREYVGGESFSSVIGYLSKISEDELANRPDYLFDDVIGKAGIEQYYESTLRGTYGKKEVEVDSLGKENAVISEVAPIPGKNIELSLDKGLQDTLANSLNDVLDHNSAVTGAAAVAIDPRNGEVLALLSEPSFDNNEFNRGISSARYQEMINDPRKPLFNRAVSGEYPSGSTIKPLIGVAGLAEGIITPSTTVQSTGGIRIGQWFFPDWKAGGHGTTDLKKAIAESVNTYFYLVGGGDEDRNGLGVDRIRTYLEKFGLNALLGIDLPGEATGFLPSKEWKEEVKGERWYIGDTYHLSIGQGDLLVTPLQVANYIATIANGGTRYRPHLVHAYTDQDGTVTQAVTPEVINQQVVEHKYITPVQEGLREAVLSGSARRLQELPVTAAGKTGTAQFGADEQTHSWFTAYAPYENPEIAIVVLVEAGGGGNDTALPVALDALKYWFNR